MLSFRKFRRLTVAKMKELSQIRKVSGNNMDSMARFLQIQKTKFKSNFNVQSPLKNIIYTRSTVYQEMSLLNRSQTCNKIDLLGKCMSNKSRGM